MKTILEHSFITKAHSLTNLFEGVTKMSTFMKKLEDDSLIDPTRYEIPNYLGDGFEFFVELFLMLYPSNKEIGVSDYSPVQEDDNGVDGVGVNIKNQKCVVQIKYRSNTQIFLTHTDDYVGNIIIDGVLKHNVYPDTDPKNYRYFVFTTAKGLNFYTDKELLKSKVKCMGYDDFTTLLNDNIVFWKTALEIVKELRKV